MIFQSLDRCVFRSEKRSIIKLWLLLLPAIWAECIEEMNMLKFDHGLFTNIPIKLHAFWRFGLRSRCSLNILSWLSANCWRVRVEKVTSVQHGVMCTVANPATRAIVALANIVSAQAIVAQLAILDDLHSLIYCEDPQYWTHHYVVILITTVAWVRWLALNRLSSLICWFRRACLW